MLLTSDNINIYGIIGWPVKDSLSPLLQNSAFKHLKLNSIYTKFPVKSTNLQQSISGLRALSIKGANITMPYKEKVCSKLDSLSEEAALIGAVNTVHNKDNKLIGYNTDGKGFYKALKSANMDLNSKIVLIGAGGAARSIGIHLAYKGVNDIIICNRTPSKAENLKGDINKIRPNICLTIPFDTEALGDVIDKNDLVVNTIPINSTWGTSEFPLNLKKIIRKDINVCDIIYNPVETAFIKEAKLKGATIIYGYEMLLYQGAIAFEIWTGLKAPIQIMRKVLKSYLFR